MGYIGDTGDIRDIDDIYYLVHITDNPDCHKWGELKSCGFNINHQFPGVYLSIITKHNIYTESLFPGKYIMIFSKILLYQINYHINFIDYNGIITDKNTYYPWTINNFISTNKKISMAGNKTMNEIIFHDNIDMKYCCNIITKKNNNIYNETLPKKSFPCSELPDMTKTPFFCYPFEYIYTGCNPLPRCSYKWYIMMAKLSNIMIDDLIINNDNKEDIIKYIIAKIKEKASYLYLNRSKQNIEILYQYTVKND